ncbi:GrpB family protein (plasmid) [Legionella sp. D16C41]|uniref:GrpB family protein n=1 Tax=Legionella sp. D16C41 TaxID=3402688 RepID=UPI003AF8F1CF
MTGKIHSKFKDTVMIAANGLVKKVEHIGSTSIRDAKAKDILDVQLGINTFEDIDKIKSILNKLGFEYIDSIQQDHVPFHEFDYFEAGWEKRFFKGIFQAQFYNIHIRIFNSKNWNFALDFKKYLNKNSNAKYAFIQFKARLANSGVSKEDYCLIKDSIIDLISLQF